VSTLAELRDNRSMERAASYVEAARRVFARSGVAKTRMSSIAAEAGVARPTLYKSIASREELLELVLAVRCRELMRDITRRVKRRRSGNIEDDLVELLAIMTEVVRDDPEFAEVASVMYRGQAFMFLTGPSVIRTLLIDALHPYFDRAEAEGRLKALPREELAGMAQLVVAPLASRRDVNAKQLRKTLRYLVCPALLTCTHSITPAD
jgi:AcrR family transcriptional regulator